MHGFLTHFKKICKTKTMGLSLCLNSDKLPPMKPFNTEKLILASQSPRRKELLEQVGLQLKIFPSTVDEHALPPDQPDLYVQALARLKTEQVASMYPSAWVLGADTIVTIDGQILGKPRSDAQAGTMLKQLSGREHSVFTGVCVMHQKKQIQIQHCVETRVFFKTLSDPEIDWYVGTREPFDKAGGYGIQGIGAFLVRGIQGSYSNVVGLPVCEVVETLMRLNIIQMRT
jgi:septum formation protein